MAWDVLTWHFVYNINLVQAAEALVACQDQPEDAWVCPAFVPHKYRLDYTSTTGKSLRWLAHDCSLHPSQIRKRVDEASQRQPVRWKEVEL